MQEDKSPKRSNRRTLALIWATAFADIFAFTILNPFLPRFYLDLGGRLRRLGYCWRSTHLLVFSAAFSGAECPTDLDGGRFC